MCKKFYAFLHLRFEKFAGTVVKNNKIRPAHFVGKRKLRRHAFPRLLRRQAALFQSRKLNLLRCRNATLSGIRTEVS